MGIVILTDYITQQRETLLASALCKNKQVVALRTSRLLFFLVTSGEQEKLKTLTVQSLTVSTIKSL